MSHEPDQPTVLDELRAAFGADEILAGDASPRHLKDWSTASGGTPLAILETRFDSEEWDYAGVEGDAGDRVFSIFVGDTTGAIFELDDNDHVAAMLAGYSCGRR